MKQYLIHPILAVNRYLLVCSRTFTLYAPEDQVQQPEHEGTKLPTIGVMKLGLTITTYAIADHRSNYIFFWLELVHQGCDLAASMYTGLTKSTSKR